MAHMVRDWWRRLLGGAGAAIIVPGMLVASLGVLAVAGGFGGLGALGQAFSGPPTPAAILTGGRGGAAAHPLPARLVAALSAPPATPSTPSGAPGARAPTTPVQSGGPGPRASIGPPASGPRTGGSPSGARPRTTSPQPQPQPQPTAIDKVVGSGTSVTAQLPGPVGSTATSALKTAGGTLDPIAPIKLP